MRRPPQLTQREGEIVPFLASGFSRAEIAQHLDVSEETVKKHTSNILAKFDSLTLRDAFYALKNYAEYYALPSPAYQVFNRALVVDTIVDTDANEMRVKLNLDLECIHGPLERLMHTSAKGKYVLKRICVDGVDLQPARIEMGVTIYEYQCIPPIKRGKRARVETTLEYDMMGKAFEDHFYYISCIYPSGVLEYRTRFVGARTPKKIGYSVHSKTLTVVDKSIEWDCGTQSARLFTSNLMLNHYYKINWQW